ncbi:MAG TPA: PDZ domain-containing protein, partial [Pirellulaceae bacterium]|nr:PDZ domain-containing protein [Pirellulaceae bacterium]
EQATPGVLVRYVYADSPAATAGVQIGDRIIALGPTDIKDAAALAEALAATQPGQQVAIKIRRDNNEQTMQATLGVQPLTVPAELPRAHAELAVAENRPAIGTIEIKLPEEKNSAVGYIPTNYHPKVAQGLLLMLCEPGKFDRDEVIGRYKSLCEQHALILILARPTNGMSWDAGDVAFLRKTMDDVIAHYNVDRNRIAVGGYQSSGTMAYFTAFTNSDLIRAVIAIEAVLPQRLKPPENEPAKRWSIYTALATRSPQRSGIEANLKSLQAMKYPVVVHSTGQDARDLTTDELKEVGRWLDSLDRL